MAFTNSELGSCFRWVWVQESPESVVDAVCAHFYMHAKIPFAGLHEVSRYAKALFGHGVNFAEQARFVIYAKIGYVDDCSHRIRARFRFLNCPG